MAQNVTVAGASYSDVPSVQLPKTGGGTATFTDTSDANATAGDIASGKTAYVNGTKLTGTASGGSNDFIVSLSKNASTGYWEPDKTWSEVSAAIADNKTFVFCIAGMTYNSELAADGAVFNDGVNVYLSYVVYETLQGQSNNYYVNEYWYSFRSTGITQDSPYVYYDTSYADATAADILSGKTAFNSSGSVSGSIPSKTSTDLTANNLTVTAPAGYYASAATKTLTDANLVAGNIKKDVTIFGVTGTLEVGGGGSLVITDVSNTTGTTAEISVSGSGGGSAQTDTGTFTGGGGNTATISCSFAPDLIYVHGDLTSEPSLRGIVTLTIIKDTYILVTCDSSTSGTGENLMYGAYGITGYSTDTSNPYATYSNGTLTIDTVTNSGSARWASGITYSYQLVKWS